MFCHIQNGSNDYMSTMAILANNTQRLSYSFVYLIMSIQLVFLLALYYKRVFMVAFLFILFPLVALSYALDKIADGKSQALNTWTKEFVVNVIIQTFHAIIYVFCLGAAYAGGTSGDWLLMIIGVTFLFKGEEIIKKIFGQAAPAGTVKSLAEVATSTVVAVATTRRVASNIKDNVIGENSHVGKIISSVRERKMYENMEKVFPKYARPPTRMAATIPNVMSLPNFPNNYTSEDIALGNAVQTLNNRHMATPEQLANALNAVQSERSKNSDNQILKDLNMTTDQLDGLEALRRDVAAQISGGTREPRTISQNIKVEMEYLFDEEDVEIMHAGFVTDMAHNGFSQNRVANKSAVREELEDAKFKVKEIDDNIKFKPIVGAPSKKETMNLTYERGNELFRKAIKDVDSLNVLSKEEEKKVKQFARNIAILENGGTGNYRPDELYEAVKFLAENRDSNEIVRNMVNDLGFDIDEYRHVLAEKVVAEVKVPKVGANKTEKDRLENVLNGASELLEEYEHENVSKYEAEDMITAHEITRGKPDEIEEERAINRVIVSRKVQNQEEKVASMEIGQRIIEEERINTKVNTLSNSSQEEESEALLNGMTLQEIQTMQKLTNRHKWENILRTGTTVLGTGAGAFYGGLSGFIIHDDDNLAEGVGRNTIAGMGMGDYIAEKAAGRSNKTVKAEMINPYTGEKQEVKVQKGGIYQGVRSTYKDSEDVRNPYIREQFIKQAAKTRRKAEADVRKQIEREQQETELRERIRRARDNK